MAWAGGGGGGFCAILKTTFLRDKPCLLQLKSKMEAGFESS
jgi:hypothetical protein